MAVSKNRQFAKIANDVTTSGTLAASAISSDVTLGGATIYSTRANLPASGNTAGDQAYVTENNRLYIWNGSGWYNIALLNAAPSIQSVLDSDGNTTPFRLATDGTATTITITALDSDGDPVTYTAEADSDFNGLATISQEANVFTVTPFSQDSATTESGTIIFKATDGINVATDVNTFILQFKTLLFADTADNQSGWSRQQQVNHAWSGPELTVSHNTNVYTTSARQLSNLIVGQTYELEWEHKSATESGQDRFYITPNLYDGGTSIDLVTIEGTVNSSTSTLNESADYVKQIIQFVATSTTLFANWSPEYPDDNTYYIRNLRFYRV